MANSASYLNFSIQPSICYQSYHTSHLKTELIHSSEFKVKKNPFIFWTYCLNRHNLRTD